MLISPVGFSASVGEVNIPDTAKVSGKLLVLNGAGMRTKFIVDVYAGALYTPQKTNSVDKVVAADKPRRMLMRFVYSEVERKKIVDAWNEGFKANNSAAQVAKLKSQIDEFNAMFRTMKAGEEIALDYAPGKGTTVSINGEARGVIAGAEFNRALMNIWLGPKPVTKDLKEALLGY